MYLVYLDESGNTGKNLADPQQPVFVLCALLVEDACWQALEADLHAAVREALPAATADTEIHAAALSSGRGPFQGMSVTDRLAFRDRWLALAGKHRARVVYRAIEKRRFAEWVRATFGTGVAINPYVAAFPLVALVVNDFLRSLSPPQLGVLISDENREVLPDVEKSIRLLRWADGVLRLGQIIEKGFFVDSRRCLPLQLADSVAFAIRKHEEVRCGAPQRPFNDGSFELVEGLVYRGREETLEVLKWLEALEKEKQRPGTESRVG